MSDRMPMAENLPYLTGMVENKYFDGTAQTDSANLFKILIELIMRGCIHFDDNSRPAARLGLCVFGVRAIFILS